MAARGQAGVGPASLPLPLRRASAAPGAGRRGAPTGKPNPCGDLLALQGLSRRDLLFSFLSAPPTTHGTPSGGVGPSDAQAPPTAGARCSGGGPKRQPTGSWGQGPLGGSRLPGGPMLGRGGDTAIYVRRRKPVRTRELRSQGCRPGDGQALPCRAWRWAGGREHRRGGGRRRGEAGGPAGLARRGATLCFCSSKPRQLHPAPSSNKGSRDSSTHPPLHCHVPPPPTLELP